MYKVLIVEDEMLVRLGLKNSIQWDQYDMQIVGDVSNGQLAFDFYEKERPDFIITDLKMPIMGGMELISKIRAIDHETRIVILSCIEDFDYARKAMSLDVSGYILKLTMTDDEIGDLLTKVHDELKSRIHQKSVHIDRQVDIDLLKDSFIRNYLFYDIYDEEKLQTLMNSINCPLRPDGIVMCLIELGQYWKLRDKLEDDRGQLIRFTIMDILNEILSTHQQGIVFHETGNRYVIILNFLVSDSDPQIQLKIEELFTSVTRVMHTYFDIPVYIGVSCKKNGYNHLKKMYLECSELMKARFFYKHQIFYEANKKNEIKISMDALQKIEQLSHLWVSLGNEHCTSLGKQLSSIIEQKSGSEQYWRQSFVRLLQWATPYLQINSEHRTALIFSTTEKIDKSENIWECIEILKHYLITISKGRLKMKNVSKEIAEVLTHIQDHFEKEITLSELARAVNFSPGYLSNLFKKEMSQTIMEYLTEFRIEKSKELLLGTSLKSYEVAEKVGFSDNGYFSRTFKRITGIRPNEFRKKLIEWEDDHENS